jgi:hypothetical protein
MTISDVLFRVFRAGRLVKIALAAVIVSFGGAGACNAAAAASPWWTLTSSSRPGHLSVGKGADEVQQLTVDATGGDVFIANEAAIAEAHAVVPWDAEATVLQEALQSIFPGRRVQVQEGSKDTSEFRSWTITFPSQSVAPLFVASDSEIFKLIFHVGGGPLSGGTEEASIAELRKGESSGRQIVVQAANLGDGAADGETSTVSVADQLPPGLEAVSVEGTAGKSLTAGEGVGPVACSIQTLICTFKGALPSYHLIEVDIEVAVGEGAQSGEQNQVSVSGGGAPKVSLARPIAVSGEPTPFGVQDYEVTPEDEGGAHDTQAGSHPFQVTGTLLLNQTLNGGGEAEPAGAQAKDLTGLLPPGLIGNPTAVPHCSLAQFLPPNSDCSPKTVVGLVMITIKEPVEFSGADEVGTFTEPLYNLEPSVGEPARFGFTVFGVGPVYIDGSVRSGGDYGVALTSENITQGADFLGFRLVFWGVPGDPAHNQAREQAGFGGPLDEAQPPPFLLMPTSCAAPLRTSIEGDSWADPRPAGSRQVFPGEPMERLDGCNRLSFAPEIEVAPDVQQASSPSGLTVNTRVPQEGAVNATGLAASDIRAIKVKLPEGVALNPAGGDGLQGCSADPGAQPGTPGNEVGFTSFAEEELQPGVDIPTFTPKLPGSDGASEPLLPGVNFCSNASKIATVKISTPLLPNPLNGAVYLASQEQNPFGSLVAMYLVAEDPISGSLVKLPGQVTLNQATGQIESTFENTPQLAFEDAEIHFFGGERAPLATPAHCGAYTTEATFTPWSGGPQASSASTFEVTSGPNGGPCPGASLPFNPTATAGATNIQAGAFSPFTFTMSRADGEQNLQSGEAKLPPGLSGVLSNVELCPEPQANEGTCGLNSLIGETTVSVGVGSEPFTVTGGKVYLTGPYNGSGGCTPGPADPACAPFGLSIVNPAKAGPFDLANTRNNHPSCDCVLVRAKIEVNPETAGLTITSNPPGSPDAIPTMIEGIPLEIQHVNITTTRSAFQFNPTNCSKMQAVGVLHSAEGGVDTITVPFQVTNCAALKFEPKFSVSVSGKTSRADGASLTAKVAYPSVPQGTDADIARVKVELPKALPSRLTTLQKACKQAQFHSDPAGCPAASIIGHAKAVVPNIPVALEGPAYFVSNGSESFPNLVIVLQGYNVTIDLVGDTFIAKNGVTSTTFKTIPDNPVSTFELTLPQGPDSALTANTNLCKVKSLAMPTEFVAQNGAEIHESTKIQVTGCAKHKAKAKHAKRRRKTTHKRRGKKRKR